jgi:spermidine/putrescine transport system ATP-binding protein
VASFMGEVNRIPLTNGQSPLGPLMPGTGTMLIRPEAIGTTGPMALGVARVTDVAFFGTHIRTHMLPLAAQNINLVIHLPQGTDVKVGDEMALFARDVVLL